MAFENVQTNMNTRYIPMVGFPMGQSSASFVYNYLFGVYGINAIMWPLEVEKGKIGDFMAARKIMKIDKIALTMPHKSAVIPYLDEADECSRLFNSVNIVKTDENGKLVGSGFDGKGCVGALQEAGVQLKGAKAVLLGAGSISGVVGYELIRAGVNSMIILNRTLEHAETVAGKLAEYTGAEVKAMISSDENLDAAAAEADVFINVRPLGMFGYGEEQPYLGFVDRMKGSCTILEAIVNPPETELVKAAERRGLRTVRGMDMMIAEMSAIFDFWYGKVPGPVEKAECKKILCRHFGIEE